ncbi:MAG: cytochrome C [candidate division NC10 bacterium]
MGEGPGRAAVAEKPKAAPPKPKIKPLEDKIHCWPYLVRSEFVCSVIIMAVLMVWSIAINAPMEEPANPTNTPNPSKAPWYFLGLQEMLVYFDPWMAGVVLPTLIIVGLMVIPFVDINPKGNGYYTFGERKFAVTMFLFGFLILWTSLIVTGVFLRGPGWNLFWPWEVWDPHKVVALTNVDLPYWGPFKLLGNPKIFGVELLGLTILTLYLVVLPVAFWFWKSKTSPVLQELGPIRYGIVVFLFLTMMGLPIKVFLRIAFNIKYLWVTPWFNI